MDKTSDDRLKSIIKTELDSIEPDAQRDNRRLLKIHSQIRERSNIMKFSNKKLATAIAAVLTITVMGTVTAVAAGKITSLIGSEDRNKAVHSMAELKQLAENKIGTVPKLVDTFSNGIAFNEGNIANVKGLDENNNQIISYPQLYVDYGENDEVTLSINKHQDAVLQESNSGSKEVVYKDVSLTASEDNYLSLPPDGKPSEADLKLQEEGKLMISYGSDQEERKVYKFISWSENGMDYMLFTDANMDLNTLTSMAKEVIDVK